MLANSKPLSLFKEGLHNLTSIASVTWHLNVLLSVARTFVLVDSTECPVSWQCSWTDYYCSICQWDLETLYYRVVKRKFWTFFTRCFLQLYIHCITSSPTVSFYVSCIFIYPLCLQIWHRKYVQYMSNWSWKILNLNDWFIN